MNVNIYKLHDFCLPEMIKKSAKLPFREIDEINTNEFVAYIDDGSLSYDNSVKSTNEGMVEMTSCDCNSKTEWCLHKISLLAHIRGNKKIKRVKISKSNTKSNKVHHLLDSVPYADLKEWVRMILENHKNLSLAFLAHFHPMHLIFQLKK